VALDRHHGVAAIVGHMLVGFSWVAALVLGAIIAPPDPVAATSVASKAGLLHGLHMPELDGIASQYRRNTWARVGIYPQTAEEIISEFNERALHELNLLLKTSTLSMRLASI
jgi:hypothetical protein